MILFLIFFINICSMEDHILVDNHEAFVFCMRKKLTSMPTFHRDFDLLALYVVLSFGETLLIYRICVVINMI